MSDLISREAAIAEITSWIFTDEELEGEGDEYRYFNRGLKRAIKVLTEVRAVDAEPVRHGKWIYRDDGLTYWWECSICSDCESKKSPYCPNCSAKMDGGMTDGKYQRKD